MSATTTGAVNLAGRVSLVTGATGGIGRYFVRDAEHRSPATSYDRDLQQRLWDASAAYIGAPAPEGNK